MPVQTNPAHSSGNCFVVMPFHKGFDDIYAGIKEVVRGLGLRCWRADEVYTAGVVLGVILDDIQSADIVICDLTGRNPNVFYETAVAHMKKDPRQVILIAQDNADVPFDLQALRYLRYDNNANGRRLLKTNLRRYIRQALNTPPGEFFESIEGPVERTRRIIAECEAYLKSSESAISSLVIRAHASLSSLAISDKEATLAAGKDREYRRLLTVERDLLNALIRKGSEFRGILCPSNHSLFWQDRRQLSFRYERLIHILGATELNSDDSSLRSPRCSLVLSPFRGNNLLLFGNRLFYQGIKSGLGSGYHLTLRVTHPSIVAAQVRAFDAMYADAQRYTIETCGGERKGAKASRLHRAVLRGLNEAYRQYRLTLRHRDRATQPSA